MFAPTGRFAWWLPPAGLLGGVMLGIVARWWMRLISTDPEFTWAGTIFIVGAFGLAGLAQGWAAATRRAGWRRRWTTVARFVAAVLTLPLFTGAGAIMLPTVVGGSLAFWRPTYHWAVRAVGVLVALPAPLLAGRDIVGDFGWLGGLPRVLLFGAIYAAVLAAMGSTVATTRPAFTTNQ